MREGNENQIVSTSQGLLDHGNLSSCVSILAGLFVVAVEHDLDIRHISLGTNGPQLINAPFKIV